MTGEASGNDLDVLAERAARGDSAAFVAVAHALVPDWYRIATHLIDDSASVEDAVQDITLKVYLALPKWNRDAGVRTWTYRIAINACHDARRAVRHQSRELPLESASRVPTPSSAGAGGPMSGIPRSTVSVETGCSTKATCRQVLAPSAAVLS